MTKRTCEYCGSVDVTVTVTATFEKYLGEWDDERLLDIKKRELYDIKEEFECNDCGRKPTTVIP